MSHPLDDMVGGYRFILLDETVKPKRSKVQFDSTYFIVDDDDDAEVTTITLDPTALGAPVTRQIIAGDGLTGGGTLEADRTLTVQAADGSIAVGPSGIAVDEIDDAQHGDRGGGSLHDTVVAAGAAGFMSGSDKSKLDGIASGATAVTVTASAPADVTKDTANAGASSEVARADHKHDVSTAAAVDLTDSTSAEGNATSLARSNHTHAHGARGGGSLHATAVASGAAGFMSGTDKAKLDSIPGSAVASVRQIIAGNGLTGGGDLSADRTLTVSPHVDGSITVGVGGVKVGILATDAQHGNRGGGGIHSDAIASGAAGFMTGADKAKLDTVADTPVTVSASRPSNVANRIYAPTNGGFMQVSDGTSRYNIVGGCVLKEPPAASTLNLPVNTGTSTLTDGTGLLTFAPQTSAGPEIRMYGKAIQTLAGCKVQASASLIAPAGYYNGWGVYMRESSTGKVGTYCAFAHNAAWVLENDYWTSPTARTANGPNLASYVYPMGVPLILALEISGSDVLFELSADGGASWVTMFTVAKTTIWTTAPNEFGIVANLLNATTPGPQLQYHHLAFIND